MPMSEEPHRRRRITLLDGMILFAALAVWFGMLVLSFLVLGVGYRPTPQGWPWKEFLVPFNSISLVVLLTPVFLLMRLRRPRPRLVELAWQPGMMACTLAVVLVPLSLLGWVAGLDWYRWLLPAAILGGWAAAAATGRLRPEPSWIDRFGRVLGVGWCLVPLAATALERF
jgi:hypothetical protein